MNYTNEAIYELKDAVVKDALLEIINTLPEEGLHPEDLKVQKKVRKAAKVLLGNWFLSKFEWDMVKLKYSLANLK